MKKNKIIAHDFNLNLFLYKLPKLKVSKKFILKDINTIKKKDYKKIYVYWGNRIDLKLLKSLSNLKYIQFGCKGIAQNIKNYINKNNIKYSITKKIHVKPVVSTILAYIFSLSRGLDVAFSLRFKNQLNRKYFDDQNYRYNDVYDESFLIAGYGEISKELVKKLLLFSKKISVINKSRIKSKQFKKVIGLNKLNKAVINKTFIINTLPETGETNNIFNSKIFKKLKKGAIFINVGRGSTVNEKDLIKYSKIKKIIIGMDVFANNNYVNPYNPIIKSSKILKTKHNFFTPHIASFSKNYWKYQKRIFYNNIKKINF